jgi:xanthine dehydrogenase accessory factor
LLAEKDLRYIEVIGSKQRTSRLLNFRELPPQISTPVGLPIGAEGPEEIAISILAELIHVKKMLLKSKVSLL